MTDKGKIFYLSKFPPATAGTLRALGYPVPPEILDSAPVSDVPGVADLKITRRPDGQADAEVVLEDSIFDEIMHENIRRAMAADTQEPIQ